MSPNPMTPTGMANCMTFESVFAATGFAQRTVRAMSPSMPRLAPPAGGRRQLVVEQEQR